VSVDERCKFSFGAWVECLHVFGSCLEALIIGHQGRCVRRGMLSLSLVGVVLFALGG
jgi:hypothetical protein